MSVLPSSDSHWDVCPSQQFSQAASPHPCACALHQHCRRRGLRPPQKPPSCTSPAPCISRIPPTFGLLARAVFPPFLSPLSVCTSHLPALAFPRPASASRLPASASHLTALASPQIALASLHIVLASRLTARISPLTVLASLQIVSSLFSPRCLSASRHYFSAAQHCLWSEASQPPQRPPRNYIGNPCSGCASRPF